MRPPPNTEVRGATVMFDYIARRFPTPCTSGGGMPKRLLDDEDAPDAANRHDLPSHERVPTERQMKCAQRLSQAVSRYKQSSCTGWPKTFSAAGEALTQGYDQRSAAIFAANVASSRGSRSETSA